MTQLQFGEPGVYRGLLLDFGGVIMKSFFETRAAFEEVLGLRLGSLGWSGPFDSATDRLWQDMLAGKLSERDYWATRAAEVGTILDERWTTQDFCRRQNELSLDVMMRPEAVALIDDASAAGVKVGVLTNELELFHGREWVDGIPFMKKFDVVVDATHTKILKPDPRAYQMALDGIALAASEVIFIDDQIRNVRGGEAMNICSIHLDVTRAAEAFQRARVLLGL